MKKIISLILALVLSFSLCTASAALPKELTEKYLNYSADYSLSVTFDSSENLIALLEEIDMPKEISAFVDLKELIRTLLSTSPEMHLQADISEDYQKIQAALTADAKQDIIFNKNLEVSVSTKTGMWIDFDIASETPSFKIIYSLPVMNKYFALDLFEMANNEEGMQELTDTFKAMYNEEYIASMSEFSAGLMEKYATVSKSFSGYTIKLDNAGLIGMLKEAIPFTMQKAQEITPAPEDGSAKAPDTNLQIALILPLIDKIKVLGDDGITYKFNFSNGKLVSGNMNADISVNVAEMYTSFTGKEWPYKSTDILEFTVDSSVFVKNIGKTKVDFPELTEENSVSLKDFMPQQESPIPDESVDNEIVVLPEYPYFYANAYASELPVVNNQYYVPLRGLLEDAYGKSVTIGYDNGVITATSEYFPGFKALKLTKDSSAAYLDGKQIEISKPIIIDGTTYVSYAFFEKHFGWELDEITHNIVNYEIIFEGVEPAYEIGFYTEAN